MNSVKSIPISTISDRVENKEKDECKKPDTNEKKRKKFNCKQKIALVMLATADFMSFCSMSIMAPFYPQEAATKGMTESMAGFVFGFYALVVFLFSPVFGKILPRVGIKLLFNTGVLISGLCSLVFGTLHLIENYSLFTLFSFLIRGLAALGASAYSTASYVIIVNIFPNHAGAVRGLLETFVGLGMSVGPAIGGMLFAEEKCSLETKSGSFTKLLKLTPILVTCFIIVIIAMTWSFLDPTLEPHLRKFNLSPGSIGLIFLLLSAMYGIFSPAWGWLTDRLTNYWWLMTVGLFFNSFSLLLLGPSPILSFIEDSIWLNIVALSSLGISVAMALMPTYQAILDSALDGGFVDNIGTHSVIAGLWSCVYSLGEVIGPVVGGALLQAFGFSLTATVFSALNLIVAVFGTLYFSTRLKKNVSDGTDDVEYQSYKQKNPDVVSKTEQDENGTWNAIKFK